MSLSNYAEDELLDHLLGIGAFTMPAAGIWAKLHIGDPGEAGTSNAATETTRKQITFGTPSSGGAVANTAQIQWTNVAGSETYSYVSLWDASTAGNCLFVSNLMSPTVAVTAGDTFTIAVGDLDASLT